MYYVYFLKSFKKTTWVYVGSTNNIRRRISEHKSGFSIYTAKYLPVYLAGYIAVQKCKTARQLEKYLKVGSGKTLLKHRFLLNEA
jgi:predicted GIY-YIG superfamily endonuclease